MVRAILNLRSMEVRCPRCGKSTKWEGNPHRPFCTERCHVVDLGNWASEAYRIAGDPVGEEDLADIDVPGLLDLAGSR